VESGERLRVAPPASPATRRHAD